jgi:phenylalanyl-tRNA synthetase beta chain
LLGVSFTPAEIEAYLTALGLSTGPRKPRPVGAPEAPESEPLTFTIPTWRVDLKREVDLIEEVVRLHGVDKIPATPPRGAIGSNPYDSIHDQYAEARRILSGLGLDEAQGQTLIAESTARLAAAEGVVPLANPLSSDMNVLRPSLLPGLLDSLRHNLNHKNYDVALFELGRVFLGREGNRLGEERRVAVAVTGQRKPLFWSGDEREARFDIFDLKGLLEEFLEHFGVRGVGYSRRPEPTSLFLESATISLGKLELGEFGQVLPAIARKYDLRDPVFLAELNLDRLLARRSPAKSFKAIPAFPAIRRDVAMVVAEAISHDAVIQAVKAAKPANLEKVELFDIFRGKHVPAGQKSVAYAFTYRSGEKTLTDAEVNSAHEKVVKELVVKLPAVVRE